MKLCFTLFIYQESLHNARSTKYKILFLYLNECFNMQSDTIDIMTQRVNRPTVAAETRFHSDSSPRGICSRNSGTATVFSSITSVFPISIFPYMLILINRHRSNIISAIDRVVK